MRNIPFALKRVTRKVPLLAYLVKKYTLISDLLRSEPHAEKAPFSEYFRTRMVTHIVNVDPPGEKVNLNWTIPEIHVLLNGWAQESTCNVNILGFPNSFQKPALRIRQARPYRVNEYTIVCP